MGRKLLLDSMRLVFWVSTKYREKFPMPLIRVFLFKCWRPLEKLGSKGQFLVPAL